MERSNWRIGLVLVPLTVATCATGDRSDAGMDAERGEVLETLHAYYEDFSARDWDAFAEHFWPGADITTVWQPPGEHSDRVVPTAIEDFLAQAPAGPGSKEVFEERMLAADIRVHRNLAQAWVRYGTRFGDPDSVEYWEGIDAFALLKHDGTWRIASLVFTGDVDEDEND
jgi:hypothetical protein